MHIIHFGKTLAEFEREHILRTLEACCGNRTRAAKVLGISIRSLRNKLRAYAHSGIHVIPAQRRVAREANHTT
jgi:two-component system response regulator FlrC